MKEYAENPCIDVKKLRKNRGWCQWEAAEKLGITRSYLSALENGKRGISMKMMAAIIHVFGVRYEDFYTDNVSDEGKNGDGKNKK